MGKQKPKLLIVDDEVEQCESIRNYFVRRDFIVSITSTGEKALELIKEIHPDVVLLDLKLSTSMTGRDVLEILREYDKTTKVVIITGDMLPQEKIEELTRLGIEKFLTKPINIITLNKTIKDVLSKSYTHSVHFERISSKNKPDNVSLRRINHELANITSDIIHACELYILDREEGFYKNKDDKEQIKEAVKVIKRVLQLTERLSNLTEKISALIKKKTSC